MHELEGSPELWPQLALLLGEDMSRLPLRSLGALGKSRGGNDKVAEGDRMQRNR